MTFVLDGPWTSVPTIPKTSVNYLEVVMTLLDSAGEILKANNPGGNGWLAAKGLTKANYLSDIALPLRVINIAMNVNALRLSEPV